MNKVVVDFTVEMDRQSFLQLVSIAYDTERGIDTIVHDLLDLALYANNHGFFPFDEWYDEMITTDCNAD